MPKGVYERDGKFYYKIWSASPPSFVQEGGFSTPEAAEYARRCAVNGHHWVGVEHDPANMWGFIYLIEHKKSGKKYVGRKQYRLWAGPQGGYKCTDPQNTEWFEESMWVQNDWQYYKSSCKPLLKAINEEGPEAFTFTVLSVHQDKLSLHLAEVEEMMRRDVLEAVGPDGSTYTGTRTLPPKNLEHPSRRQRCRRCKQRSRRR